MKSPVEIYKRIAALLRSQRGHNALVFLGFLAMAITLWFVLSLSEEEQCDMRMPVRLTHVPDSVTIITRVPSSLSVSASAKGTQLLKMGYGTAPALEIDFRIYGQRGAVKLSSADLKALARSALGGGTVMVVSPDTINLAYTTRPGLKLPIVVDANVTPGPQATVSGRPRLSVDSVQVYSLNRMPASIDHILTEPIRLTDVNEDVTMRVRLIAPDKARVIPDSVDVTFGVERLILKTRRVVIEPIHVPANCKLITFPAQIDVHYMVPMSVYKHSAPQFRVVADYGRLNQSSGSHNIKLRLVDVPDNLQNVHLSADSAEYIIERL